MTRLIFSFYLILAISTVSSSVVAQDETGISPCRKNVLIYFDASGSMVRDVGGQAIMQFMLRFLKQAIDNRELIENGDYLVLKRFSQKSQPFTGIESELVIDEAGRKSIKEKINTLIPMYKQLQMPGNNNYISLVDDIVAEISRTPNIGKVTNYVVIFSDFLYDPDFRDKRTGKYSRASRPKLEAHKTNLENLLYNYSEFFNGNDYRLILIYKANPNPRDYGIDVFDSFEKASYSQHIMSPENIDELIENLQLQFVQPIRILQDSTRFRYENGELALKIILENPNCEAIEVYEIRLDPITGTFNKATQLSEEMSESLGGSIFDPLSKKNISLVLKGTPTLQGFRDEELINKTYNLHYSLNTDLGDFESDVKLRLRDIDFVEQFKVKIDSLVIVDHVTNRFDKLFLKLGFAGALLDRSEFTVKAFLQNYELESIQPQNRSIVFNANELIGGRTQIYIYTIEQDERTPLSSVQENLPLFRVEFSNKKNKSIFGGPTVQRGEIVKELTDGNIRDYRFWEIAIFCFMVVLSYSIHRHYRKKLNSIT